MFAALAAVDISDLFRDMHIWVTRVNDASGDVSFADLSDGGRQFLMVLGLIRVARGKHALFLLDEPDTHLNPVWQHLYLSQMLEAAAPSADVADRMPIHKQVESIESKTMPRSPYSKAARAQLFRLGAGDLCAQPEEVTD